VSAATTDGVAAHAGPAQRAGRPGTGTARPRVAARAYGVAVTSARARSRGARAGTGLVPGPGRRRRVGLAWPRLPAAAEVAIVAAGYAGYALVRLAVRASRPAAIAHAAGLWRAERWLHLGIEPSLNHLAAARPVLAETAGYYYGLAHFIVTPLVLAWLWLRRPAAFGPLRSALVLATTAANVVFWTWPAAPPRFAVPGMTDILVRDRILGAGRPHGPDSLVNLYAAMPSLHVAWAAWCAAAIVAATRTRWRHLAWLYPAATTVAVLATANHFLADAAGGLAITALGLLAARARTRPDAAGPGPGGAGPAAASPARGPGAAPRRRRSAIWRRLARRWGWAAGGAAAALIALRAPAVAADVRAALAHGWRLPWLGAAVAAGAICVAGLVMAQRQLLAAAGQLGARLVPLPGGLGGLEGGVLALTGAHPATALTAVIIYRIAGYWAPGAAGAVTAALLTRRHRAQAARPVTPLNPQAPPPPALGQPPSPRRAASAAGACAARPWPAPGRPARLGLKPARAHPTADPASRIPRTAAGQAASARSPHGPGATGPAAWHGCGPAPPFPAHHERHGATVIVRRRNEQKKGTCHEHPLVTTVRISAPRIVPVSRPTPPNRLTPPMTTAAIAVSSNPSPEDGAPAPRRM
jgi:hypothetical protein